MSLTLDQAHVLAHLSPHSPELMPIPMRHLLASSAVAALLVLLPVGDANAQDNRNTWGWGTAGGVLTFIAGGAVGGIVGSRLSKLAFKGKRDEGKMESKFTQLSSSVKALDEKLTKLGTNSEEGIDRLSHTLESKMNPGSVMNAVSTSLETVKQHIVKVEEMVEKASREKEDNQTNQYISSSDKSTIENCNNKLQSIIIDTSAIINGSIISLLEADLPFEELKGRIIIHECVQNELKGLLKRKKGDAGCDNFIDLCAKFSGRIDNNSTPYDLEKADEKLLQLTSDTNGMLVTRDVGLAKKCCSKNLKVLNLDDLYRAVRRKALVGREVSVYLHKQSEEDSKKHPNDAVAWIDDRRIVVKNANDHIGQSETTIIITHASERGTYFAEILTDQEPPTIEAEQPPKT